MSNNKSIKRIHRFARKDTRESLDNIILGQVPKRIIIGFVQNKASNGDRALNPFNSEHFGINYSSLYVDGP